MNTILKLYKQLSGLYGPQGWWPLIKTGYHPLNYDTPKTSDEVFEVCIGALLAQNTNWNNAFKALKNMHENNLLSPKKLLNTNISKLKELLKPAGYYNQKTGYVLNFTKQFSRKTPTRDELLSIKGVGFETADSILLYAYKIPSFVVDAYTKRILTHHKIIKVGEKYNNVKKLFEASLPDDYKLYQEYHALLVEHGKLYYSKKPYGVKDPTL